MQPQIVAWSIGADPELFLKKNNHFVASQGYIKGSKKKPYVLPNGGNAQRDNVACEFGVPPAYSAEGFVHAIGNTINDLKKYLPKDIEMVPLASATFPKKQLRHQETKQFGCDPDYNAWTMEENEVAEGASKKRFRSCGGHVHIGINSNSPYQFLYDLDGKAAVIRGMDAVLGIASTVLDNSPESIERRKLYGKAGCFRPTVYGVEYRTLSNFWIRSPILVRMVYHMTNDVLRLVHSGGMSDLIYNIGGDEIQNIINLGMKGLAEETFENWVTDELSLESLCLYHDALRDQVSTYDFMKEWELL